MRKLFAVLAIVGLISGLATVGASAGTFTWTLPTSYTDNTPIAAVDQARIVVEVYESPVSVFVDTMTPIFTSAPGATAQTGNAKPWNYYSGKASLGSGVSAFSTPFYYIPGLYPPGQFKYNQ